ncbi:MAG: hypothetical protein D0528_04080 [Methylococcales bacterium]|jgi:hypothetical protein|nr:MAG: hypothetical protein D0528_04080 [Methylococcales bacterium]
MQPLRRLMQNLDKLANAEHYLFTPDDLRALLPDLTDSAFNTLLCRVSKDQHLTRLCRGLYFFEKVAPISGLLLFHAAARLRADCLNYISLETVLSDAGVISQIPINHITVMSSGRSSVISCGRWGTIEFVRTRQKPQDLEKLIYYDARCKLWRATVPQALRDMRVTHRNTDLIDWSVANEFV